MLIPESFNSFTTATTAPPGRYPDSPRRPNDTARRHRRKNDRETRPPSTPLGRSRSTGSGFLCRFLRKGSDFHRGEQYAAETVSVQTTGRWPARSPWMRRVGAPPRIQSLPLTRSNLSTGSRKLRAAARSPLSRAARTLFALAQIPGKSKVFFGGGLFGPDAVCGLSLREGRARKDSRITPGNPSLAGGNRTRDPVTAATRVLANAATKRTPSPGTCIRGAPLACQPAPSLARRRPG